MKNLIFNGIHNQYYNDFLKLISKKFQPESITYTCSDYKVVLPSSDSRCTFVGFDHFKNVYGQYPESETAYIDAEILKKLEHHYFNILEMFARLSPDLAYSYEDRMKMAFDQIRFWNDYIDKNKIDLFLSMNYPHETYDYVIYALCKVKGITTLFFTEARIDGYVQLLSDIEEVDPRICLPNPSEIANPIELGPLMQKHFNEQISGQKQPFYVAHNENLMVVEKRMSSKLKVFFGKFFDRFLRILKYRHLTPARLFKFLYFQSMFGKNAEKKLYKFYESHVSEAKLNEKFIYFPLHFQPENSTCPMGGYFNRQNIAIELLSRAIPEGFFIYVKEHPTQRIHGRSIEFYEKILKLKNVKLIPKTVKSHDLIKNSFAVATITGTAGWEALFNSKPVILFGNVYYQYVPNVFRVKCLDDVKESLKKIINNETQPCTLHDLKIILGQMEKYSIRGWVDPLYRSVSMIDDETNLQNLLNGLEEKLKLVSG